ncbi:hypothetical protein L218DRAFT_104420 [Marasmius fiardii PR-910]|nr:hypothetical protein L218DRAFT_104420 [Marasmius fiardii PR-910]
MSLGRPVAPITPEEYIQNMARFELAQQALDQWRIVNDMGLAAYDQRQREERELQQKIEAQERALNESRQRLLQIQTQSDNEQRIAQQPPIANRNLIWAPNVSSPGATPTAAGLSPQTNHGHNPYQHLTAPVLSSAQSFYRPFSASQSQSHVQKVVQNPNYQNIPASTSIGFQPSPIYNQSQQSVTQVSQNAKLYSSTSHQTSSRNLAQAVSTPPVNVHNQTSRTLPNSTHLSSAPTNVAAVPISQTLSGTKSNPSTSAVTAPISRTRSSTGSNTSTSTVAIPMSQMLSGTNSDTSTSQLSQDSPTKLELFRRAVSEWAKTAPQRAYCSAIFHGVEVFPYKDLRGTERKVSVLFRDPETRQFRDIKSDELEQILEGRYQPRATSQIRHAPIPQTQSASASQTQQTSTPAQPSVVSVTPTPNTPKTKGATTKSSVQSGILQRTPSQANKATIARDVLRVLGRPSGVLPPLNSQLQKKGVPSPKPRDTTHAPRNAIPSSITAVTSPSANGPTEHAGGSQIPPSAVSSSISNVHSVNELQTSVSGPKEIDVVVIDDSEPGTPVEIADRMDKQDGSSMAEDPKSGTTKATDNPGMEEPNPGSSELVDSSMIDAPPLGTGEIVDSPMIEDPAPYIGKRFGNSMVEASDLISSGSPVQGKTRDNLEGTIQGEPVASGSSKPLDSPIPVIPSHIPTCPPRERTPLFLPSPEPATSQIAYTPEIVALKKSSNRKALRLDYVAVPSAPEYVNLDRERRRWSKRRKVESPQDLFGEDHENAQTSLAALVQEAFSIPSRRSTPGKTQRDAAEEAVIKDASTRLQSSPCRWRSCDAVMNSMARLERHLQEHVGNMDDCEVINCLWQDCGRSESSKSSLISHVMQHIRSSLACPYEDCEKTFRTSRQLLNHCRENHSNGALKTSADPIPSQAATPPECPNVLPSYMVVARHVSQHPMTREQHQSASAAVRCSFSSPITKTCT